MSASVTDGAPFAVRIARDVVRVSGPDAVTYLQGQLSQDIAALAVSGCTWTFILQPQGKVDGWFRITRLADDVYLCDIDGGYGDSLIARLNRFKLRVQVSIEPLEWECVAVRGVPAADIDGVALGAPVAAPVDWSGTVGVDLLGPAVALPAGVAEAGQAAYDAWRVAVGMPAMGRELDETTIPAEAGVVDISVSFTKGCYTGQELVARVDSRGNRTPRRLRRVVLDAAVPSGSRPGPDTAPTVDAGTPVRALDGREVGVITTAVEGVALAYIRREVEPPAGVTVAGFAATVESLPSHSS